MSAVIGALRAELSATIAKFQEDMKNAGAAVREFATKAEATGKRLQRVGRQMSLAVTAPLVAFGVKSVQAATESAQALGLLEAALAATGHQAGRTSKQLQEQAKALESISTFDDDDILRETTTNLLKFGNVVGGVFDRAQVAIIDMASRTGSLTAATQSIGRALNDPIAGLTALSRAGVQFTAQQKEQIKTLVDSGRGAEAQVLILERLEQAYGGAAQALREATPTAALNQQWRELTEIVGGILINILPPVIDLLRDIAAAFNSLSPEMQRLTVYVGLFAAAIGPLAIIIGTMTRAVAALAPLIKGLAVAFAGITAVTWAWLAAIGGIVAALLVFWNSVRKILGGDFTGAWEDAKNTAREMWDGMKKMFANDPIEPQIKFAGDVGEFIAPGKTNFNLGTGDGAGGGSVPSSVKVTDAEQPAFSLRDVQSDLIAIETDRILAAIDARRETAIAQESAMDLHLRRGDEGFLSDEMMRRLGIARDLTFQQLDAEARIAELAGERRQAELVGDMESAERLSGLMVQQQQVLDLVNQTSVAQIRREERLQEAVGSFIGQINTDIMSMLEDWNFSLKDIGRAFQRMALDILVRPSVEAATDALGGLLKAGFSALGFAQGGFAPPGRWAVVGEQGPKLAFGGRSGMSVFSNEDSREMLGGAGGLTVNVDARGSMMTPAHVEQAVVRGVEVAIGASVSIVAKRQRNTGGRF